MNREILFRGKKNCSAWHADYGTWYYGDLSTSDEQQIYTTSGEVVNVFPETVGQSGDVERRRKMNNVCKFCGKEIKIGFKPTGPNPTEQFSFSCGECYTQYCMKKCEIASSTTTSWHKGKCLKCEHNPYFLSGYVHDGARRKKDA